MSQYFKGSGPFDFFAPLGTHLLNFFGNIERALSTRLQMFHTSKTGQRQIGTARMSVHVARLPARLDWHGMFVKQAISGAMRALARLHCKVERG